MRVIGEMTALAIALLLAGCGGSEQAPDRAATPAQATVAPTSSPATSPANALASASALPPTWTPRAQIMLTVAPGPSPTRPPDQPTWTPLPDWCNRLRVISAPGISYTHLPAILSWAPVPNVEQYRVELRNSGGGLLLAEVTSESEYTFGGDLFQVPGAYGWQVTPLDETGQPVCYALADEIVVRVPPS